MAGGFHVGVKENENAPKKRWVYKVKWMDFSAEIKAMYLYKGSALFIDSIRQQTGECFVRFTLSFYAHPEQVKRVNQNWLVPSTRWGGVLSYTLEFRILRYWTFVY